MSRDRHEHLCYETASNTSERLSSLTFHGPGFIGDVDTLMAATALERNLTVITLDQDFTRVPGLRVQLLERPRATR
jgi:predicted nucleic acid-binding protein